MGWLGYYRETNRAGLDISPKLMTFLNNGVLKGKVKVDWRFVAASEVPEGPWKDEISGVEADSKIFNLKTKTLKNQDN
jgi:hypothetical protein